MTSTHISVAPCTIPVGPQVSTSRDPLEMFSHYFDEEVLSHIVRETNRFAAQCFAAANSDVTWETDLEEVRAYLGFMVVMGVNRLPELRDYWSMDPKMNTHHTSPSFSATEEEAVRILLAVPGPKTTTGCALVLQGVRRRTSPMHDRE